jgi:hypothetical protein
MIPNTKLLKESTDSVAARVPLPLKKWIVDQARDHQMSVSEYAGLLLGLAAQEEDALAPLQKRLAEAEVHCEDARLELEAQRQSVAWYRGAMKQQIDAVQHNAKLLNIFYSQHGNSLIPMSDLVAAGFKAGYLLCSHLLNGQLAYGLGEHSWYYASSQRTHIHIVHHGTSAN